MHLKQPIFVDITFLLFKYASFKKETLQKNHQSDVIVLLILYVNILKLITFLQHLLFSSYNFSCLVSNFVVF